MVNAAAVANRVMGRGGVNRRLTSRLRAVFTAVSGRPQ
jgi:hypothetical protein